MSPLLRRYGIAPDNQQYPFKYFFYFSTKKKHVSIHKKCLSKVLLMITITYLFVLGFYGPVNTIGSSSMVSLLNHTFTGQA